MLALQDLLIVRGQLVEVPLTAVGLRAQHHAADQAHRWRSRVLVLDAWTGEVGHLVDELRVVVGQINQSVHGVWLAYEAHG